MNSGMIDQLKLKGQKKIRHQWASLYHAAVWPSKQNKSIFR